MNSIKRGIISVRRKPAKTMILFVIIFVLGNIIAGAISIRQAITLTEINLYNNMSPFATVTFDSERITALYQNDPGFIPDPLSVETIKSLGALPYMKYFDYYTELVLASRSLEKFSDSASDNQTIIFRTDEEREYFILKGVRNPEIFDMKDDKIRLVAGRIFTEQEIDRLSYLAIVSESFAATNDLTVGSRITFENNVFKSELLPDEEIPIDYDDESVIVASRPYEFEIIGIFEPVKKSRNRGNQFLKGDLENRIYISTRVLSEINDFRKNLYLDNNLEKEALRYASIHYTPIYVLNDPRDFSRFKEDADLLFADLLLPDYYTTEDSGDSFEAIAATMRPINRIAASILYTTIGATICILSLLITLFLRDRRHEIGIYLSLGEKKIGIAGQILLEVLLIAVVAISLSVFSASLLSGAVSDKMLVDQIIAEQQKAGYSQLDWMGYQSDIDSEDIIGAYGVSLRLSTILLFYAFGIGTVCVAALVPIIYTTRLNPRRIMM
jgi:putative ABC transport system permease protein